MLIVYRHIRITIKDLTDELIGGIEIIKAVDRNRILNTAVVCVKGNDRLNTHLCQLLKCLCTVQRLICHTDILTSLIQIRHDNCDPSWRTATCHDNSLQIHKMIVRRHL